MLDQFERVMYRQWMYFRFVKCSASLFLAALVFTGAGAAQMPAEGDVATTEYDATIASALSEFQAGRFPEARALFERAHAILPNARALRGIGIAAFEMRDYPHAWVSLRASLDHPVRPLALEQREDVVALLARTELFLARIELVGVVASAHVLVDGRDPIASGTAIIVGPGAHTISVEVEGMRTHTQTIDSVSGTTQRVAVTLVPLTPPAAVPANAPGPHVAPPSRVPALVLLGSGAAIGVVGITSGSVGLARARDGDADATNARRLGYAGDTLMGLGLAAGIAAIVWRVAARDVEAPPVSAVVTGSGERAMLYVGGPF